MSENYKRLDAVQQEIKDLLKKKTRLKKKEQKGQLTEDEEIDLDGLTEELKELKEDKKYWQGQVDKENKPEETSKSFGEADAEWIASVTGINYEYREWTAFASELDETVIPSPGFQQAYENVSKAFHMRTEAGRRIFLNLFLSDIVLLPAFNDSLRIFPEIEMSVESKGPKKRKLNGKTDYTVGFGKNIDIFDNTPPRELHLVAIEARNSSLDEDDLWQCVAETATLYKSRKDAGKAKCAVWGVLSNATDWKFIHIDEDGKLWRSEKYLLNLRSYNQNQILFIYRLLHYVVKCCYESSTPTPTSASSSVQLAE
ncbi:hypothetical protein BASA50_002711 [Batrachochytrium salamandrivorans]|uniref:Uncharacterized protein n=1 Tax=Batrachochytrium salamandrivorans TaxID=1357716 RepID=A0ABQ8FNM6_9FUNG|nr:hypothetical protein BASA62_008360 [Batrachochytrium salamandrivorans]KAH6575565.1 hypothetical protein BASA60_004974 [Batrachochytrium salamandrivorans]KAH6592526.1 hypothetical protein BASA61_004523 [Batrachochytrium salamandrivorans]KAH6599882.1 hypothetical protein BASA50_002711 [Batrachochytrium salamandrivorans]KAH9270555.1 hypothetical protein BASA83_007368 [Batrachochytrium salamandrivorans]